MFTIISARDEAIIRRAQTWLKYQPGLKIAQAEIFVRYSLAEFYDDFSLYIA